MTSTVTTTAKRGAKRLHRVITSASGTRSGPAPTSSDTGRVQTLAERHANFPGLKRCIKQDARMFAAGRGERHQFTSKADLAGQVLRLAWTSDAFLAFELYRVKAYTQAKGIPVIPRVAHRLAMTIGQVCIGDAVIIEPGVYLPHGQVVIDGQTHIGANTTIRPWVTIAPRPREHLGPTIGRGAELGTGCQIIGHVTVGPRALIGANAAVTDNVPAQATAVGVPAHNLDPKATRKTDKTPAPPPATATATSPDPAVVAQLAARETTAVLIAAADEAISDHRPYDAIALLSAANRNHRDPALERALVRVRHEGAILVDKTPGTESWPPALSDPFPELHGIPEISPDELTSDVMGGAMLHHGAIIVRGFLPAPVVDNLRLDVDLAFEACDTSRELGMSGQLPPTLAPHFAPFNPPPPYSIETGERAWVRAANGVLLADSPHALFDLLDAYADAGVRELLAGYLGTRPAFSLNKSTLRRAAGAEPSWHQDGAFLGADVHTVNIWLSLSDCGEGTDTIGMDLVPRRIDDLLETGTHGSWFPNSVGPELAAQYCQDSPLVTPRFAPGDIIIFDDRFLHRTGVGEQYTETRYAIESWFFDPAAFPAGYTPLLF